MSDQKFNFNVSSENGELVIRHGDALPLRERPTINIDGVLSAPGSFLLARYQHLAPEGCILTVNKNSSRITFRIDYNDRTQDFIQGELKPSTPIKDFGINEAKTYSSKELAKFLKKNAYYFADKDQHTAIIIELMKFEATVTTVIEDTSDNRGNIKKLLEKAVETKIPEGFIMKAPIFSGYEAMEFEVLISAEASSTEVRFYLESPELFMLVEQEKARLIAEEVKPFEEFGCAILYLS